MHHEYPGSRIAASLRYPVAAAMLRSMKPFINLEEEPGKTVGRRSPPEDAFAAAMVLQHTLVELSTSFGHRFIPRGVYRFRSHQEADAWMWKQLARCRKT